MIRALILLAPVLAFAQAPPLVVFTTKAGLTLEVPLIPPTPVPIPAEPAVTAGASAWLIWWQRADMIDRWNRTVQREYANAIAARMLDKVCPTP